MLANGYSFMPANAALRCQSNKADRSSWPHDDGLIGTDLLTNADETMTKGRNVRFWPKADMRLATADGF
jgi:hypothetical protein